VSNHSDQLVGKILFLDPTGLIATASEVNSDAENADRLLKFLQRRQAHKVYVLNQAILYQNGCIPGQGKLHFVTFLAGACANKEKATRHELGRPRQQWHR